MVLLARVRMPSCMARWQPAAGSTSLSLLPVGLAQTWASVEHGMWYARSAEFLQTPVLEVFRWLRSIGDTIFAVGILALGWFVIGLSAGWSQRGVRSDSEGGPAAA